MTVASPTAVQICDRERTAAERSVEKIVRFFGVASATLQLAEVTGANAPASVGEVPHSVLISAAVFDRLLAATSFGDWPRHLARARSIFVSDFNGSAQSVRVLRWLTGQAETGMRSAVPDRVTVTAGDVSLCGALSGITAQCSSPEPVSVFVGAPRDAAFRPLLTTADGILAFTVQTHGVRVFVSSAGPTLDLDAPVDGNAFDVRKYFSSIVPITIFLKDAFPDAMPPNRSANAAFIVDDPALKLRYGFLDFASVLSSMKRHRFATTIAFIPWNWRRTNPKTAGVFLNNPDSYSLVVHGCDHTSNEFGTASVSALNHKVKVGVRRVKGHLERTGVRVSPIMVFPQGVFSPEAAYVLKCNNFIAAVNTDVNPAGDAQTEVRELWKIAIMKYASFPIFTRRYMSHGLENFAFDAFLGKPCLLVAHHEVFKDNGRELIGFIDALNTLAGGLKWGSLEAAVRRSFASRLEDGSLHVEMFASEMVLDGETCAGRVRVTKTETDPASIRRVMYDGLDVDATCANGVLTFFVDVTPGTQGLVRIEYVDRLGESVSSETLRYKMSVGVRRYLSEVRDDYVCRSEFLTAYAAKMRRLLKAPPAASRSHG
jgi:hypothetical protein